MRRVIEVNAIPRGVRVSFKSKGVSLEEATAIFNQVKKDYT